VCSPVPQSLMRAFSIIFEISIEDQSILKGAASVMTIFLIV
jgi:hypothetical protein